MARDLSTKGPSNFWKGNLGCWLQKISNVSKKKAEADEITAADVDIDYIFGRALHREL